MKEARRLEIRKKVLTKTNVLTLAYVFFHEYQSSSDLGNNCSISFQLACNDGTSYESDCLDLFEDGGVIDIKRSNSIDFTFHDHTLKHYISLTISHGGGYRNNLTVQGFDSNWVNGVFTKIKEKIDSFKPQDNWLLNHEKFVLHSSALGIGAIVYFIVWLVVYRHLEPIKNPTGLLKDIKTIFLNNPWFFYVYPIFSYWIYGISWALQFRRWLFSLWPDIEFDFGPEHFKLEKTRRVRIYIFASLVIIPLLLSLIYDLSKLLITK